MSTERPEAKGIPHPDQISRFGLFEIMDNVGNRIIEEAVNYGSIIENDNGKFAAIAVNPEYALEVSLATGNEDTFVPFAVAAMQPTQKVEMRISTSGYFNGDLVSARITRYGKINPLLIEYFGFMPEVIDNGKMSNDMAHGVFMMNSASSVLNKKREEMLEEARKNDRQSRPQIKDTN